MDKHEKTRYSDTELQEFKEVSKDLITTTGQLANFTGGTQQAFDDLQQLLSSQS